MGVRGRDDQDPRVATDAAATRSTCVILIIFFSLCINMGMNTTSTRIRALEDRIDTVIDTQNDAFDEYDGVIHTIRLLVDQISDDLNELMDRIEKLEKKSGISGGRKMSRYSSKRRLGRQFRIKQGNSC